MPAADILDRLYDAIRNRERERPDDSYVVQLLDGGVEAIAAKVREEAEEVIEAASQEDAAQVAHEAADLLFHLHVLMAKAGVVPGDVYAVLEARFGIGGLEEKRNRGGDSDVG